MILLTTRSRDLPFIRTHPQETSEPGCEEADSPQFYFAGELVVQRASDILRVAITFRWEQAGKKCSLLAIHGCRVGDRGKHAMTVVPCS